jgi:hypothetical protein
VDVNSASFLPDVNGYIVPVDVNSASFPPDVNGYNVPVDVNSASFLHMLTVVGMWWLSWLTHDWVNQTATQQFWVRSQLPPQSPEGRQEL